MQILRKKTQIRNRITNPLDVYDPNEFSREKKN